MSFVTKLQLDELDRPPSDGEEEHTTNRGRVQWGEAQGEMGKREVSSSLVPALALGYLYARNMGTSSGPP